jgi:hypothetical protein
MKIIFKAYAENAGDTEKKPQSAIKFLPKWFNKIPQFSKNDKKFRIFSNGEMNSTIKWCNPFLDSLSAGYMIQLEYDLQVTVENGESFFVWKSGGEKLVDLHSKDQISKSMIPNGFSEQPYKFRNDWAIKTPKGYSALFVHPLNRGDLPFYTLSGFVDTDDYNVPVNFPFLIQKDFEGVILAGTPIAQIIPIKRESWQHEISGFDPAFVAKASSKFEATIYRAYKNLFWKRKDYK